MKKGLNRVFSWLLKNDLEQDNEENIYSELYEDLLAWQRELLLIVQEDVPHQYQERLRQQIINKGDSYVRN